MRRIVTAITAAALALSLVSMATPANAVAGYDSAYAGESAFLTLNAGQSGTFTVFFQNTGTTSWAKGTATQVDLAACTEDKLTCNAQDASEAPFASGWLSTTRYATHTQTTVAPGSIGTFTYNVAVPSGQAAGTYRFNGALVLSATGADIHNEGYYQDVTVPTAVGSCTPTAITTSPTIKTNQVGVTHTQTATVTCAIPTGGTTAPASVGTQVSFVVDAPTGSLNADMTLTATTDANGIATVTWTRNNPDVDTVAVYPTSTPAVRATATKQWAAGTFVIQCEPATAATVLAGSNRNFTVTVRSPSTGALAATQSVTLAFVETSSTPTAPATPITTGSTGTATFALTGADNTVGTVRATTSFTLSGVATTFRADCGTTTFQAVRAATITVTPDTTATNATDGRRVYTIAAIDQFGNAFAGTVLISFNELVDSDATTTTTAVLDPAPTAATTAPTAGLGACPAPTANLGNQRLALTLNSSGGGFFQVCSATATTGTPIVWHDRDANAVPSTGEASDTGGAKTWAAATLSGATLTPASATNTASSETTIANDGSLGEETFTYTFTNQSGNAQPIPAGSTGAVTFTVTNTGSTAVRITSCAGGTTNTISTGAGVGEAGIPVGGSGTCTITGIAAAASTATVELDNNAAGSASISATGVVTVTASGAQTSSSAGPSTKTWVAVGSTEASFVGAASATGNVVAFDKTQDVYTISTATGNFTINYAATDTFTVDGTTATYAQFKTNLTIGDKITWTRAVTTLLETHALTNQ